MLKKPCIYLITCNKTLERYVGSAHYLRRRFNEHKYWLKRGEHANHRLQALWEKHGEPSLDLTVIEYVIDPDTILIREQYWIDTLKPELNISLFVEQPSRGIKRSAATVERMRQTRLEYHAGLTPEQKAERRDRVKQGWHEWWDALTDEERQEARKNRSHKQTDEVKDFLRQKNIGNKYAQGVIKSTETRAKLSAALTGRKMPPMSDEQREGIRKRMTGNKPSPETLKKMADSHRGQKRTDEQRQRMSKARRGKKRSTPMSDDTKEKLRQIALAQQADPEYRKKHQAAVLAKMQDPDVLKRLSEAHKGKRLSAEQIAKIVKSNTGKKRSEESKKRLSDARRKWWAERKLKEGK